MSSSSLSTDRGHPALEDRATIDKVLAERDADLEALSVGARQLAERRRRKKAAKRRTKARLRHLLFPNDYPGDVPQMAEEEASMNAGRPAKGPFAEALGLSNRSCIDAVVGGR